MAELIENLRVLDPVEAREEVVFVDDVLTTGEHLAAADRVLTPIMSARALVVGVAQTAAEAASPPDASVVRDFRVSYRWDHLFRMWEVTTVDRSHR